jgi:SpoVK/Ycf46/Vps4 family AAA+-type ATPase
MPKRFAIRLPNHAQRLKILRLMLAHATLSPGFDFEELARRTDGLSGSDLKETCRNAAMIPVRELMREKGGKGIKGMEEAKREVGLISVLVTFFPTGASADEYDHSLSIAGLPTSTTEDVRLYRGRLACVQPRRSFR